MCGVIGVYCEGIPVILDSILSSEFIYHRGHDSSGIATTEKIKLKRLQMLVFSVTGPKKRGEKSTRFLEMI